MKSLLARQKLLLLTKPQHCIVPFRIYEEAFRWIKISRAGDTLRAKGTTSPLEIHTLHLRNNRLIILAGVVEIREE